MSLLDKSTGGFITAAFAVVYGVVAVECWMLTTNNMVAMAATVALVIVVAGALSKGMLQLMGPEEYILGEIEVAPAAKAPTQAPRAVAPRVAAQH